MRAWVIWLGCCLWNFSYSFRWWLTHFANVGLSGSIYGTRQPHILIDTQSSPWHWTFKRTLAHPKQIPQPPTPQYVSHSWWRDDLFYTLYIHTVACWPIKKADDSGSYAGGRGNVPASSSTRQTPCSTLYNSCYYLFISLLLLNTTDAGKACSRWRLNLLLNFLLRFGYQITVALRSINCCFSWGLLHQHAASISSIFVSPPSFASSSHASPTFSLFSSWYGQLLYLLRVGPSYGV